MLRGSSNRIYISSHRGYQSVEARLEFLSINSALRLDSIRPALLRRTFRQLEVRFDHV